jgi:hypothetical protein
MAFPGGGGGLVEMQREFDLTASYFDWLLSLRNSDAVIATRHYVDPEEDRIDALAAEQEAAGEFVHMLMLRHGTGFSRGEICNTTPAMRGRLLQRGEGRDATPEEVAEYLRRLDWKRRGSPECIRARWNLRRSRRRLRVAQRLTGIVLSSAAGPEPSGPADYARTGHRQ